MRISAESPKLTLTFLFLVIIFAVRYFSHVPVLVGGESYYSLRISEEIRKDPIISADPLGENYSFSIFHYFLSPLNAFAKTFIPLILALFGGLFYYKSIDKDYRSIATALLFSSPLFLVTFVQLSSVMFATFLVLLNLYNITHRKILSFTLVQTILALANFEIWLFSTAYFIYRNRTYVAAVPGLLLAPLTADMNFVSVPLFSEFGSFQGYSLFLLMLAVIGFFWRKKNPLRALLLLSGLIFSIYLPDIRILGTLVFASYASRALRKLISRDWVLPHIKQATIFLIFLVLAFSAIAKAGELVRADPADVSVFEYLKSNNEGYGLVLSLQELGHYIQYYSGMPVILDGRSSEKEVSSINQLLKSQNVEGVIEQLSALDVKYVIMPRSEERTGILFVADNSPNLQLLMSGEYELWQFIP